MLNPQHILEKKLINAHLSSHYGTRSSKQNISSADVNPMRPETSRYSSKSISRLTASVTSGPGKRMFVDKSNNEALHTRHGIRLRNLQTEHSKPIKDKVKKVSTPKKLCRRN
jgi:hypothetical protein